MTRQDHLITWTHRVMALAHWYWTFVCFLLNLLLYTWLGCATAATTLPLWIPFPSVWGANLKARSPLLFSLLFFCKPCCFHSLKQNILYIQFNHLRLEIIDQNSLIRVYIYIPKCCKYIYIYIYPISISSILSIFYIQRLISILPLLIVMGIMIGVREQIGIAVSG